MIEKGLGFYVKLSLHKDIQDEMPNLDTPWYGLHNQKSKWDTPGDLRNALTGGFYQIGR